MTYWLFQAPNLLLAAMMYTLVGTFLLSLFFPPESEKVIWRVFAQVTRPAVRGASLVTPRIVPERLLVLVAAMWCLMARLALFFGFVALGLRPTG